MSKKNRQQKPPGGITVQPEVVHNNEFVQPLPSKSIRTITLPPGIGDIIWVFQKLINTGEKFNFIISDKPPQRGHQIFELLPQLVNSWQYAPDITYKSVDRGNITNSRPRWAEITETVFNLSANRHLEEGNRIEQFLPDLPTSYRLDYATTENDKTAAAGLLPSGRPYIGIYTSAYGNVRNWNGWGAAEWFAFIRMMNHKNVCFVIIGASYDVGVNGDLKTMLDEYNIDYIDTTGQPLSVVIEILKRLSYFVGFPSGLSILNETLGKDGTMMYSKSGIGVDGNKTPDHRLLMNAWPEQSRIDNHNYKGCIFPKPEELFMWLKTVYQIFDRI